MGRTSTKDGRCKGAALTLSRQTRDFLPLKRWTLHGAGEIAMDDQRARQLDAFSADRRAAYDRLVGRLKAIGAEPVAGLGALRGFGTRQSPGFPFSKEPRRRTSVETVPIRRWRMDRATWMACSSQFVEVPWPAPSKSTSTGRARGSPSLQPSRDQPVATGFRPRPPEFHAARAA